MNSVTIKKIKSVTVDAETTSGNYVMTFSVEQSKPVELTQTRDEFGPSLYTGYELKFSGNMDFLKEEHSVKKIQDMVENYNFRAKHGWPTERKQLVLDYSMETGKMCVYLGGQMVAQELTVRDTHVFVSGLLTHQIEDRLRFTE